MADYQVPDQGTDPALDPVNEAALSEAEIQAGVDEGYQQVADRIAVERVLNEDDLARIANALRLAWSAGVHNAHKVHDRDMATVMQGMAASYNQTLEKVERLLDARD